MILAILQARISSSRLPGKVSKILHGKPMLLHQVERLRYAKNLDRIIVATSTNFEDNIIEEICINNKIQFFRGSLNDVLDRYYQVALIEKPKHIVRVTGDCPLIDPNVLDAVVTTHLNEKNDYTSNTRPPTFPDGLDIEVMTYSALERAWKGATLLSQREHVTLYIYQNIGSFKIGQYQSEKNFSNMRWTVDEPEDFQFVNQIYKELYNSNPRFLMEDILDLLNRKPGLIEINNKFKRNEGLNISLAKD